MATIYLDNKDEKYNYEYYEFKIKYERDMRTPFVLNKLSITYCLAYYEVNLIDLIFLNPNNFETRAFELKLKDWKGVVYQATQNLKICNYSSIVMPYQFLMNRWDKIKADVENTKIGVYGVKEGFYKKGDFPKVHEFKNMRRTNSEELINKVREDYEWIKYYDPMCRKYSNGFIQMYKKTNTYELFD